MITTTTVSVTLFGETHEIECLDHGHAVDSTQSVLVGRFPTGTKLHRTTLRLWPREQPNGRLLGGQTAAVVDGREYVADLTLYTHNRNVGRIIGWDRETFPEQVIAKW
jgi:hypothetical protein